MKLLDIVKNRFFLIALAVLLFSAAFTLRLYSMQIIEGEAYSQKSVTRIYHRISVEASRGNIYDRNGVPLALNREASDIYIRKAFNNSEELNASLLKLYNILEDNGEDFNRTLEKYFTVIPFAFADAVPWEQIEAIQTSGELFRRSAKDMITDPFYFFEFLKDFFYISDRYTTLESYRIMVMRYEILRQRWQYLTGEGIRIAEDVSLETMAQIAEQTHHLQGVMTRTKMVRIYTDVYDIGHVLGYIGPVTAEDIGRDPSYSSLDQIGKSGVEAFAENHLRGIRGSIEVETDPTGRIITEIGGEKAVNGKDIYLTIDIELQRTAMESLRNNIERIAAMKQDERHFGDANAGSVVVLDVRTGEVLAMASYPSYDPNWFVLADEQSMENRMKALTDSATTPMFNRAIQALYTPGSTYKPIVAVAGLESGAITEHSTIACTGHEVIGEWDFYCLTYRRYGWVHGDLTIQRAIETSCNLYFYKLGVETGIDELDYWARHFGLGEPSGIDLYGEQKGIRSSREYKYATFADRWYIADTAQSAIGQMYNNFTPLQMANYTASISNGGKRFTPFVLKEVRNQAGEMVLETQPNYQQVPWEADTFRILKASMRGVVLDGTAQRIFEDFPVMVAGKTGTAETGRESGESSNALFIAYAPYEEPEIAVAVVIEKGVWGSYTAYVAKDIFSAYFNIQPEEDKTDE